MTPAVLVYLFTYRRKHLLRRSVDSLLAQSFQDWICEVHNDDPYDDFPSELVSSLDDSRVTVVRHKHRLGPTAAFNLAFRPTSSEFISILEDDNWWEPEFLAEAVALMKQHETASVCWANMNIWREFADGRWEPTGATIWNLPTAASDVEFRWPGIRQMCGAYHSNGAMLLRGPVDNRYVIPEGTTFAAVEAVRERCFAFPLLFLTRPLANFAITRDTSQANSGHVWDQFQALLTASFLEAGQFTPQLVDCLLAFCRANHKARVNNLLYASFTAPGAQYIRERATLKDWIGFLASVAKGPLRAWSMKKAKARFPDVYAYLLTHTRQRFKNGSFNGTDLKEINFNPC